MNPENLRKILERISRVKVAVIGDFCLDAYWFVDISMSEISIETGQETRPVMTQKYSLGGAGNVTNNLAALGVGETFAFGVIGPDPFGREMLRLMTEAGINTENLVVSGDEWQTHTYSKPYIGETELNRIDFGNFNRLPEKIADELIGRLKRIISKVDAVIINQQVPSGIHTGYFRKKLAELILLNEEKLFITDSRNYNDYFDGSVRKMNDIEALRLCGIARKPDEPVSHSELEDAGKQLFRRYGKPFFITRGAKGSMICDAGGLKEIPGILILAKTDTVGAGDSYLAGAASALAAGCTMEEAAYIGTLTAGVTVQKLFQTGTATPVELMGLGNDPDMIFRPDLAENPRRAEFLEGSEIEIINRWQKPPGISHAIFDHDGTVSTLREGWEMIMEPVMVTAILGEKSNVADDALFNKVKARVKEFIDKTTGVQTIAQMDGLLGLIREFGLVPLEKMLDARGYKKLYNEELLKMVHARESKFVSGELSLQDLTVKNAVPFLEKLHKAGIRLYLASGTDLEDVRHEAEALGYASLFEGRIYGSVGDIRKDAKKVVLDAILDEIGDAERVVTFGDGPVEISETRKRGGLTVGVASNEQRRYGLNAHKRERLIKAGADIVVPDFTQYEMLIRLLNI